MSLWHVTQLTAGCLYAASLWQSLHPNLACPPTNGNPRFACMVGSSFHVFTVWHLSHSFGLSTLWSGLWHEVHEVSSPAYLPALWHILHFISLCFSINLNLKLLLWS